MTIPNEGHELSAQSSPAQDTVLISSFTNYFNQGISFLQNNDYLNALANLKEALQINPNHFDALQLSGLLESQLNNNEQAIVLFLKALEINQSNPHVYNNCGLVYEKLEDWKSAGDCYLKALILKPDFAQAHNNFAGVQRQLHNTEQALASYDLAIQFDQKFADPHYNKANVLRELRQLDQAYLHYKLAIELNPLFSQAFLNLGLLLSEVQKYPEALDFFNQAIAINPNYVEAFNNKGNLLQKLNQFDSAVDCYQNALRLNPNLAQIHNNLGNVFHRLNRLEEASDHYEQAITLSPDFAEAHWNNALALLMRGEFTKGWKEFEWRWQSDYVNRFAKKRTFTEKLWLGDSSLVGKRILLHSEQGLGDTIQFARFAPFISNLGAEVTLEVQPSLVDILKTLPGNFTVIPVGAALPSFDFQCPLLSLPLALNIQTTNIPLAQGYLKTDPALVNVWLKRLGPKNKPRIGIVCSGSQEHTNDFSRSYALKTLLPYLPDSFEYHILQKEIRDIDLNTLEEHPHFYDHAAQLSDFTQTAALIDHMDLVITVDTSVAHLSGALAKETWVLLPFRSDWRWLTHQSNSLWYKSIQLVRQDQIDNWNNVFEWVNSRLLAKLNSNR